MPSLLWFIWMLSLVLAAGSFCLLAGLILARLRRDAEHRADPHLRSRLSRALRQLALSGEKPDFSAASRRERRILAEEALDAAQLMRGAAKARLIALLREIRLDCELRRKARRGNIRDRLAAIEALALFADAETAETLKHCEASRDLRISLTALRSRTAIGFGPDIHGLLSRADEPGAGRSPLLQELVEERTAINLQEALRVLGGVTTDAGRALLIRAIGETRSRDGLQPLRIALLHPDGETRAAAAGALGALGYAEAADWLERATLDPDWRVRLRAADAIGRLGAWRCAAALEPLLEDQVWWVRFRAEEALVRLHEVGLAELSGAAAALHAVTPETRRLAT